MQWRRKHKNLGGDEQFKCDFVNLENAVSRTRGGKTMVRGGAQMLAQSINTNFGFNSREAREKYPLSLYIGQHFDHFGHYATEK
jgi:hypothetical protein